MCRTLIDGTESPDDITQHVSSVEHDHAYPAKSVFCLSMFCIVVYYKYVCCMFRVRMLHDVHYASQATAPYRFEAFSSKSYRFLSCESPGNLRFKFAMYASAYNNSLK